MAEANRIRSQQLIEAGLERKKNARRVGMGCSTVYERVTRETEAITAQGGEQRKLSPLRSLLGSLSFSPNSSSLLFLWPFSRFSSFLQRQWDYHLLLRCCSNPLQRNSPPSIRLVLSQTHLALFLILLQPRRLCRWLRLPSNCYDIYISP